MDSLNVLVNHRKENNAAKNCHRGDDDGYEGASEMDYEYRPMAEWIASFTAKLGVKGSSTERSKNFEISEITF